MGSHEICCDKAYEDIVVAPLIGREHLWHFHDSFPGEDELLVGFFIRYWEMLETTGMGGHLIHFIPKEEGDREEICHWRPITLLGTTCKILAKASSL